MISLKQSHSDTSIDYSFFPPIEKIKSSFLTKFADKKTPIFALDLSIVHDRYHYLKQQLAFQWKRPSQIAYSFKTNYDLIPAYKFDFAEVVSDYELRLALKLGYQTSQIIYNGPHKESLEQFLSEPVTINLDNNSEIDRIADYLRTKSIRATLGLRLNTKLHPSRFGFNLESGEAASALKRLLSYKIPARGFHIHLGSDISDSSLYLKASQRLSSFIQSSPSLPLSYIDFGGGYPSHSLRPGTNLQSIPKINNYLESICRPLSELDINKNCSLILEPGRYLVDDSVVMVSRVINTSLVNKTQFLTLDSTINMLPSAWYHPLITKIYDSNFNPLATPLVPTVIYGSTCQESDCLFKGNLPQSGCGDKIIFYSVGAYNQSQSANFIYQSPNTVLLT